ncbi:SDR family NAD(P)-dependent oxidoreductase, partial [Nonomuraea sp. PA05]|uniref:SDR family NAD(P)-dependent oxidoreductase n=1 Tax=Nonomuraea sp. PA05 TaxID=2604466 RepID=UPI001CA340B5
MESEQVETCLRLLGLAKRLPAGHPDRRKIEHAATGLIRDGRHERRAAARAETSREDGEVLAATAMGAAERRMDTPLPTTGPAAAFLPGSLRRPRHCYVCQQLYSRVHHFYHRLCPDCAVDNFTRRTARADLSGRRVLLTGGRVKIGHELALMLLRDGAEVTVTTRFPADAVRRFAGAAGAGRWQGRLRVAALDLRDPRQVVALTDQLLAEGRPIDILVNNAAQTLRRPASSYAALAAAEAEPDDALPVWRAPEFTPPGTNLLSTRLPGPELPGHELRYSELGSGHNHSAHATPEPAAPHLSTALPHAAALLPGTAGLLPDVAGLLPDTSPTNSWSARLGDVDPVDLLEAQLVNAIAPFLMADRLL